MQDTLKCNTCHLSSDVESFSNNQNLGFRIGLTLFAWILLGYNIPEGHFYFSSILLFVCPLTIDYIKYTSSTSKIRNRLRSLSICLCGAFIIFSLCGFAFMSIENINNINYIVISENFLLFSGYKFEVKVLWCYLFLFPILTTIDYFAHATKGEISMRNSTVEQST